jgi:hypothetical protein
VAQGVGRATSPLYFPGAQSVQAASPAPLYLPRGHCWEVGVVDPAGQAYLTCRVAAWGGGGVADGEDGREKPRR